MWRSAGFERVGVQVVAGEQFVKIRAIAFCEAGGLAYVAGRDLQDL
jgi:hypothetical protein